MRLTPEELFETLNNYFSKTNDYFELLVLFTIPLVFIAILIMLLGGRKTKQDDFSEVITDKDYKFIEVIRQTKKLEEFDRDLLIELAIQSNVSPIYMPFIDKESFSNVEIDLIHNLEKNGQLPSDSNKYEALRLIKNKLF